MAQRYSTSSRVVKRISITASSVEKEAGAIAKDDARRIADRSRLLRGLDHRFSGEEGLIHGTHVDVPAFAFRSFDSGQVAHRRLAGLHVGGNGADHELTLEGIYSHLRIGNRAITRRQPVDVCAE